MLIPSPTVARNQARLCAIRDASATACEALACFFTDGGIRDDGTPLGRLRAILAATEHRFIPGLHFGIIIGLTGFHSDFDEPWATSRCQVSHFLTAVRLTVDPFFLANPAMRWLLGAGNDPNLPVRLIVGHEKATDPEDVDKASLGALNRAIRAFRRQYHASSEEDVANFLAGKLDAISIGKGNGNSYGDLRLSYKGWRFGQQLREGGFASREALAEWVRRELGRGDTASRLE